MIEDYRYWYDALVLRVIDGDTIEVSIDLGFNVRIRHLVRLARINAPELNTEAGKAAKKWLSDRVIARVVRIQSIKDHSDKYGRFLAELHYTGGCLNDEMVGYGYAEYHTY